jgi:hypothetical protein
MSLSGVLSENFPVLVRNPLPGGGDSNSLNFTIFNNHTFYAPVRVSNMLDSRRPDIAVDNSGNIYVIWEEDTLIYDVYFSRSTDIGVTWSQDLNLAVASGYGWSWRPDIAVDSNGNINIASTAYSNELEVHFSRSTDNGANWSQGVNISLSGEKATNPAIALDSAGNINVVFEEWAEVDPSPEYFEDIYFLRSQDDGVSWSQKVNISNTSTSSIFPAVEVDNSGNVYVVWMEGEWGTEEIYFNRSQDNGVSWSQNVNISNRQTRSLYPDIAADNSGNIYVVWEDSGNTGADLYFKHSSDMGVSWSQASNITNTILGDSYSPAMVVDSAGNINIVWTFSTWEATYFKRSTDMGVSWSQSLNISNPLANSGFPDITVDEAGNIYIAYTGPPSDPDNGSADIYFTGSTH